MDARILAVALLLVIGIVFALFAFNVVVPPALTTTVPYVGGEEYNIPSVTDYLHHAYPDAVFISGSHTCSDPDRKGMCKEEITETAYFVPVSPLAIDLNGFLQNYRIAVQEQNGDYPIGNVTLRGRWIRGSGGSKMCPEILSVGLFPAKYHDGSEGSVVVFRLVKDCSFPYGLRT